MNPKVVNGIKIGMKVLSVIVPIGMAFINKEEEKAKIAEVVKEVLAEKQNEETI